MPIRNLKPIQAKPEPGDIVSDGFAKYRVIAVGLKYVSVEALDGSGTKGCVKIMSVFKDTAAPPVDDVIEEEEEQ